ncbi:receptor-binding cancer antigen expressed on SiSo cells isoform X1 [Symphalangus syndactylus]|uniref:receptor-binding cancer antigen expressed on SiSo cells isoform X1 n=1 Tax=Symphalangus syndactylus TaxID=9590 RepID=UPI003003A93D
MAITQFRLFKFCTCLATVFSFLKRLICRSGRGRKLSGDQITLPTTVDYSSVPKQTDVEEWTSWDEDAPTSVKIEGGNGNVATPQNSLEQLEPDYFKDMTPTIRKTQKIVIKKREPLNFGIPDGSTGFSSRLAATQDLPFIHQSSELGDLDTWQENTNAWEEEEDAAWQAEEVLRSRTNVCLLCSLLFHHPTPTSTPYINQSIKIERVSLSQWSYGKSKEEVCISQSIISKYLPLFFFLNF